MMPVQRNKATPEEHPELVKEIARVLDPKSASTPQPGEPDITIDELRHSNAMHVTVIWDEWANLGKQDRAQVILDAIAQALGEGEMLRTTLPIGLTTAEAKRLLNRENANES